VSEAGPLTMTLKEFALHIGRVPSYVTKLKQDGRLVFTPDADGNERVDVEASKKRIEETAGAHGEGARDYWAKQRQQAPSVPGEQLPLSPPDNSPDAPESVSKADWDRREAAARAQLREIELAKAQGSQVDTATVRRAGAEAGAALRAALEHIPDKLAPAIVGIQDEAKVHAMLVEHMEIVLSELSRQLDAISHVEPKDA
jgi:hypothetical protein